MRFGLIGTGYWANAVHAAGIARHPEADLVGVWGRDSAKAAEVASLYGAEMFVDLDVMLNTVEAVAFSVPPHVQAPLAIRAADAGKHLLLEKPLAVDLGAAQLIVDAVRSNRVASVIFFTERFIAAREAWLTQLARQGRVLGGSATWLASLRTPNNPFASSPWRQEKGALWDVGPHALSVVLPVLGPVKTLVAARGFGDLVHIVLGHYDGASSVLALSLTMPPEAVRFDVEFYRADGWHSRPAVDDDPAEAYRRAVTELIESAGMNIPEHRCDVRFGRDVVRILEQVQHALD